MPRIKKAFATGVIDCETAVRICRTALMRAKRRRTLKALRHRNTLVGISIGPKEIKDMDTMKKSKRHQASVKNSFHQRANIFTSSSTVKIAVKALSRFARKIAVLFLDPSGFVRPFSPSCASTVVAAKFCSRENETPIEETGHASLKENKKNSLLRQSKERQKIEKEWLYNIS